jgi:hypothetical protein
LDRRHVAGTIGCSVAAVFIVLLLPVTIAPNPAAATGRARQASTTTSASITTTPGQIPVYEFTGSYVSARCGSVIAPRHYRGLGPGVPLAESLTSGECGLERDRRLFYAIVIGVGVLVVAAGLLLRRVRFAPFIATPVGGLLAIPALIGVVHRM